MRLLFLPLLFLSCTKEPTSIANVKKVTTIIYQDRNGSDAVVKSEFQSSKEFGTETYPELEKFIEKNLDEWNEICE
jgi:hypothetical protein